MTDRLSIWCRARSRLMSIKGVQSPLYVWYEAGCRGAHCDATAAALKNLSSCVEKAGVEAEEFGVECVGIAEAVLDSAEKEMGVNIADIGGGTTDIALYADGAVAIPPSFPRRLSHHQRHRYRAARTVRCRRVG